MNLFLLCALIMQRNFIKVVNPLNDVFIIGCREWCMVVLLLYTLQQESVKHLSAKNHLGGFFSVKADVSLFSLFCIREAI